MPDQYVVKVKGRGGKEGRLELPTMPERIEEFLRELGAERAPDGTGLGFDPYFAGYAVTDSWWDIGIFRPTGLDSVFDLNDLATLSVYYGRDAREAADIAATKAAAKGVPATTRAVANFLMQTDDMPIRSSYESTAATPEKRFMETVFRKTTVGEAFFVLGYETDAGAFADVPLSQAFDIFGRAMPADPMGFAQDMGCPGETVLLREYGYAVPEEDFRPDPGRYSLEEIRSKAAALRSKALEIEQLLLPTGWPPSGDDLAENLREAREDDIFCCPMMNLHFDGFDRIRQEKRRGYDTIATSKGTPGYPAHYGYVAVPEGHPLHGVDLQEAREANDSVSFAGRLRLDDNRWWLGVMIDRGKENTPIHRDEMMDSVIEALERMDPQRDAERENAAAHENAAAKRGGGKEDAETAGEEKSEAEHARPEREETSAKNEAGREEAASEAATPRAEGEEKPAAAKEETSPTREPETAAAPAPEAKRPARAAEAKPAQKAAREDGGAKKGGPKRTPPRRGRDGEGTLAERQAALRREVCEQLADDIENLGEAWADKWAQPGGMPQNPVTGGRYGGGNAAALMCAARQKGFSDNRWCSFDDAKDMGWRVRKGEKGTRIEHWKPVEVDDGLDPANPDRTGHVTRHMKLHSIRTVFNLEQIDGAPQLDLSNPAATRATTAEAVLAVADALEASSRCGVDERSSSRAFYSPAADGIVVPKREQFPRPEAFVSTLLREMARSTAPALGRPTATPAANRAAAAKEELTAELSSMIAAASLGVGYDAGRPDGSEKRTASLELCADAMRHDPDVLFRCAGNAQRAANLVVERFDAVAAQRGLSRPAPEKLERPTKTRPARAATAQKTESLDDKLAAAKTSCEAVNAHRGGGHGGHGDDPR